MKGERSISASGKKKLRNFAAPDGGRGILQTGERGSSVNFQGERSGHEQQNKKKRTSGRVGVRERDQVFTHPSKKKGLVKRAVGLVQRQGREVILKNNKSKR